MAQSTTTPAVIDEVRKNALRMAEDLKDAKRIHSAAEKAVSEAAAAVSEKTTALADLAAFLDEHDPSDPVWSVQLGL